VCVCVCENGKEHILLTSRRQKTVFLSIRIFMILMTVSCHYSVTDKVNIFYLDAIRACSYSSYVLLYMLTDSKDCAAENVAYTLGLHEQLQERDCA
jgi:hypothetical protein